MSKNLILCAAIGLAFLVSHASAARHVNAPLGLGTSSNSTAVETARTQLSPAIVGGKETFGIDMH